MCNCEELRKELIKLKSKYEDIQHVNKNLEKNMASLLKTAKVEVARKDRIIGDLRKQYEFGYEILKYYKNFFSNVAEMFTDWMT